MDKSSIIEILPLISEVNADGPSYSVIRLCQSLINLGLDIKLINCDTNKLDNTPEFLERFSLGFGPKKLCRSPDMYNRLCKLAKDREIKLIHSHGLWTMPNIYPKFIKNQFDIPYIISPRGSLAPWAMQSGSFVKKFFWPLYQKSTLKNAIALHATSESEYQDIRKLGFTQPVAIIPNGIDIPEYFKPEPQSLRTLLFLGRIHPIKGLDMLLHAWQKLQHKFSNWQLQIAGPDSRGYLKTIKNMAIKLKLERIEFSGLLTGDAKLNAYRNAELFILPSYTENFGMVAAEALAAGTPVIATHGTPWEALEQHNAGWWVNTDTDALIKCLAHALTIPPTELSNMGQNGREWMINDLSWDNVSKMMKQFYQWVLEGGTPPNFIRLD